MRLAGSLGMTLIASATDVLTDRTSDINPYGHATSQIDKSTKNALLQGASEVARTEAERHTEEMQESQSYLTVNAGSDLIVSLLSPFKGESFDE